MFSRIWISLFVLMKRNCLHLSPIFWEKLTISAGYFVFLHFCEIRLAYFALDSVFALFTPNTNDSDQVITVHSRNSKRRSKPFLIISDWSTNSRSTKCQSKLFLLRCLVSITFGQRGMSSRQNRYWNAVRWTGHVIQTKFVAKRNTRRLASVFAADAYF